MTTPDILNIIAAVLVLAGSFVTLLAAVGMIRFPDTYTRMHAASKPSSLGLILLAAAAALQIGGSAAWIKMLLVVGFIFLKAPVSAQALARAAKLDEDGDLNPTDQPSEESKNRSMQYQPPA